MTNTYHEQLLAEVKARAAHSGPAWEGIQHYLGTSKVCYPIGTKERGQVVRDWLAGHPALSLQEYCDLIGSLCRGESFDEIALAGALLGLAPRLRKQIDPHLLERWLDAVEGWAETDSLCMSHFTAQEILARWEDWQRLLTRLAVDGNIHKRRASLVLLTKAVRDAGDERLAAQAFANIDRLKGEKHILITKAVSWLLRDLVKHCREQVVAYLETNEASLPRIAVRETRKKILTGRKAG